MNKELPANATLSHYRVVSKIGEGGMGVVYLAQDTKLDRKVALKILPADVATDQTRMRRFVQEAKAASALNHPNIITIHEIEQIGSINFIATEFIDGETLRQRIRAGIQLTEILEIAIQIASALAAAHSAGIIHRDIKPENIMVRNDGYIKVLDFGLAKLAESRHVGIATDPEAVTRGMVNTDAGMVVGTAVYMSPEQAKGAKVDQRTDLWSLGAVLYEMITGCKPFLGETPTETISLILQKEPAPLTRYAREVPSELERIVNKALTKDCEERYQSAKDLLIDLRHLKRKLEVDAEIDRTVSPEFRGGPATAPAEAPATKTVAASETVSSALLSGIKQHKLAALVVAVLVLATIAFAVYLPTRNANVSIDSIAVLPFENRSADVDTEYLSDGLAESLIYRLSQLPSLKVSPTSSVIRYKGKDTDITQIATELEVDAVMSGRVSQRADDLTISVELVDARTKKIIWAEHYDRKMSDLLATQREIATSIAQKLEVKLSGNDAKSITKRYTDNNDAYQLYLRGRYSIARFPKNKDNLLRAIEYFRQAIKLDPKFALAYAGIAQTYLALPAFPYLSPKEAFPQAKAAAQRALEIDPTLSEAHTVLGGSLVLYDWNWPEAERSFKRAIELDPNNPHAHFQYATFYLMPTRHPDEAIAEIKRGLELEPLNVNMGAILAGAYLLAGQNDKALEQAKKTYEIEPDNPRQWIISQVYIKKGMYAEAISLDQQWLRTDPTNQFALRDAGIAYAKVGRREKAEEMISRFREIEKTQYVPTNRIACIYGALGDKEKAFAELNKAFEARDWELFRLNFDPYWDSLRDDPQFKKMLKRLNLPE